MAGAGGGHGDDAALRVQGGGQVGPGNIVCCMWPFTDVANQSRRLEPKMQRLQSECY